MLDDSRDSGPAAVAHERADRGAAGPRAAAAFRCPDPARRQLEVRRRNRLAASDPVRANAQGHAGVLAIEMIRTSSPPAPPQAPPAGPLPNGNGHAHVEPFLTAVPQRNGLLRTSA